jgi:transcriptional activator protein UGA3
MVSYDVLDSYSRTTAPETLHTLTGLSLPLFGKIHRIAALVRQRRTKHRSATWSDEALIDIVQSATRLEAELKEEKHRLDALILGELGLRGL